MKTIQFTIPAGLVLSLNRTQRMHWGKRSRLQEEMDNLVYYEIRSHFASAVPSHDHATVKMTLYSRHMLDHDNLMGGTGKFLHDSIVKVGLVPDDNPRYLEMQAPEFEYDKHRREIEVTITVEEAKNGNS